MRMERKLSKERANNQNFYAIEKSSLEHQGSFLNKKINCIYWYIENYHIENHRQLVHPLKYIWIAICRLT